MLTQVENEGRDNGEGGNCECATPSIAFSIPSHIIIYRIFSQLDCVDLLSCSLVCKQWYHDSMELRFGWRDEYLEACNSLWVAD